MTRKIEPILAATLVLAAAALAGCEKPQEAVAIHYPSASEAPASVAPSTVARAIEALPEPDRGFVQQALGANLAAIRFGQLAMEKGSAPAVRDFGREMMDNHMRLNERLRQTARSEGNIVLPVARLSPLQETVYARLSQLSGPEFDRELLQSVLDEQQHAIDAFHHEATDGRDPAFRELAGAALPRLRDRVRFVRNEMQIL